MVFLYITDFFAIGYSRLFQHRWDGELKKTPRQAQGSREMSLFGCFFNTQNYQYFLKKTKRNEKS
jgi:hypothetical protein